eukprot:4290468-Alexandrium_andersonii.AAC.1
MCRQAAQARQRTQNPRMCGHAGTGETACARARRACGCAAVQGADAQGPRGQARARRSQARTHGQKQG